MVQRIPYPQEEKLEKLPPEAKFILSHAKNLMNINQFKIMQNAMVALNDKQTEASLKNTDELEYAGELQPFVSQVISSIGAYNPDRIPYEIYEAMSRDPTIALGLSVIKHTPTGLNWRIECKNPKQRDFLTQAIKLIYRNTVLGLTDACRMGVSVGEKCWAFDYFKLTSTKKNTRKEKFWYLKNVKFVHPRSLRFNLDEVGNLIGVTQIGRNIKLNSNNAMNKKYKNGTYITLPVSNVVMYTHNFEFGNFFGISRLKNAYPAWYWSQVLTQFMLKYLERMGQPLTVMYAPPGTRTNDRGEKVDNMTYANKIGQMAVSNSVVTLPTEYYKDTSNKLWEMNRLVDDKRGDMFIDILNHFDSKKLRALFIPDKLGLASDGSSHSASGASAGDTLDVFMMTEQSMINDIESVIDDQIIYPLQANNFDESVIEDAHIKIEKLDFNRKMLMKEVFLRMVMFGSSGLANGQKPKDLPSIKKLAEILDLPIESFNEMFEEMPIPENEMGGSSSGNLLQKKQKEDSNNKNRNTSRKDRAPRDRSMKEKRQ